jgi:hypothetical protein
VDLTNTFVRENEAEWSPNGAKIVFTGEDPGCPGTCNADLWVMNADGTGRVPLTNTAPSEASPDWQPVVGPAPPGYPRPKGATPFRVSLVPAYAQCTSPNRTHGSPLSFGSCSPPAQASPRVTIGTPDANGAPAKMSGWLRIDAIPGNPATPANEADARVTLDITDVRCRPADAREVCYADNTQAGRDYSGDLRARMSMRLTDRYNLPAPGGDSPATMSDTPLEFNVYDCTPTPSDPSVGSTCSLTTTTAALLGWTEGRRAIMELGQVEVLDGGPNGDVSQGAPSSGMSPFLRQGVFVP